MKLSKTSTASSAPGKLLLFGEHAVVYGHPCIVTAVDQRLTARVTQTESGKLLLKTPDIEFETSLTTISTIKKHPKEVQFVLAAVVEFRNTYPEIEGLEIETKSAFSSKFGFGSSSAVTVAVLHALHVLYKKRVSKQMLFDMAYRCVLDVQGVGSGFDVASAIWGGTILYVMGGKKIEPIKTDVLPITVAYTGVKVETAPLINQVSELKKQYPTLIEHLFNEVERVVELAKKAIEKQDWQMLGVLMNLNQGILESLGVSSKVIHQTSDLLKENGVLGAKLSGAGGGDCVVAVYDPSKQSIQTSKTISVALQAPGVRTEVI